MVGDYDKASSYSREVSRQTDVAKEIFPETEVLLAASLSEAEYLLDKDGSFDLIVSPLWLRLTYKESPDHPISPVNGGALFYEHVAESRHYATPFYILENKAARYRKSDNPYYTKEGILKVFQDTRYLPPLREERVFSGWDVTLSDVIKAANEEQAKPKDPLHAATAGMRVLYVADSGVETTRQMIEAKARFPWIEIQKINSASRAQEALKNGPVHLIVSRFWMKSSPIVDAGIGAEVYATLLRSALPTTPFYILESRPHTSSPLYCPEEDQCDSLPPHFAEWYRPKEAASFARYERGFIEGALASSGKASLPKEQILCGSEHTLTSVIEQALRQHPAMYLPVSRPVGKTAPPIPAAPAA